MKKVMGIVSGLVIFGVIAGCAPDPGSSDQQQQQAQEQIGSQSNSAVGMPAISNFTEKKELKMIYELRDKSNLTTYLYTQNAMDGKWVYQGQAVGFPIPYSTEYTNPSYVADSLSQGGYAILPQADPNALFSSQNTQADWIMRGGPNGLYPAYMEPNVYVTPVKEPANLCEAYSLPKGY